MVTSTSGGDLDLWGSRCVAPISVTSTSGVTSTWVPPTSGVLMTWDRSDLWGSDFLPRIR